MKTIDFTNPHRRKHFEFFRRMEQPHFNITANVQIPNFLRYIRERRVPFTPAVVYCIARAANAIPAFKQRVRGENVVEHEQVHPSFTVQTDVSDVFSFCDVPYDPHFGSFVTAARARDQMRASPSLEDEEGRTWDGTSSSCSISSTTPRSWSANDRPSASARRPATVLAYSDPHSRAIPRSGRDLRGRPRASRRPEPERAHMPHSPYCHVAISPTEPQNAASASSVRLSSSLDEPIAGNPAIWLPHCMYPSVRPIALNGSLCERGT